MIFWQERWGSNPQPPVLETGTLPIELLSFSPLLAELFLSFLVDCMFAAVWAMFFDLKLRDRLYI